MPSIESMLPAQPLSSFNLTGTDAASRQRLDAKNDPQKVAKDFESVFASMMLKEMRKSIEPNGMFGEDTSDIYGGMFDQYLGEHISEAGGFGIARLVRDSLAKSMTKSNQASNVQ